MLSTLLGLFPGTIPQIVDEEIPGISELSDGIKAAKARIGHLAVPAVNNPLLIMLQEKLKLKK